MAAESLYKEVLLDHFHHPRNKGDLAGADVARRGSNPRCGDDLEVGVDFDGDTLTRVRFHGRGCSICIASASMMTDAVVGKSRPEVAALYQALRSAFVSTSGAAGPPPAPLLPLAAVQKHPARHRCVLLAWEALEKALDAGQPMVQSD